ncbi:DNA sulfur modification protein DndD [Paenibacillus oleatilyticus]|uniref:DNA sulfur modification protein DndD n=1 Tax=Paenibacillus oleatilyticus TaxID=2594886 RepID=UPI001C1F5A4D|nr:DNA sulfur modification protein DndD [Paenibacillus oleatilyticus]MBU7315382.1 DNA sulfur modification protein DndD [Paenibacillus oleatilyticus]
MIFNYITFENYRPYYGTQKLELHKKKEDFSAYDQNITLVGGLNGAGKTSLINAFFICFYGRRKFSKDEYEIIKNEAINRRYYREGGRESKIQLSFTDRTGTYVIEITFKQDQKNEITETRRIFVASGDELREVTTAEEEFNEFIDQRIPIDVAPFFIFDAEKIRDLVGEHDTKETIKAIQKIVSLELYNQLYEDLFRIRNQDEAALAKTVKDEDLQKLSEELQKCATELELLKSEERPDEKKIEFLNEDKNYLNQKRRLKLANSSVTKGQINRKIGELENELKLIFTTLERFGRNSLPNLIAAPVVRQLQQRIKKEQNYINSMTKSAAMFAPYDRFISQILNVEVNPPLNNEQKEQLKEKGKSVWAKVNQVQEVKVEPINVLHVNDLSQNELQMLLNSSLSSNVDVKGLVSKRIKIQGELQKLLEQLNDAPDVIDTKEEDEKLAKISEELGALYAARKTRGESIRKLQDRHHQLLNEITRKRQAKSELGPVEQKMELMTRLIGATKEFIDQVTILKAKQLKNEIETILLKLFRKRDLHRVEFDPNEFALKIYDEFGRQVDLTSRSEGEKQLIALSMIWALTKVSGTNFPFVIDTPLARLDSIHRANLVNRYFTNLSDQVIILTTDTEITKDFVEEIEPFVQKSYLLQYDDVENSTKVSEGYFTFE